MEEFDFINATDKPALLAISTREWREQATSALVEQGYKVQAVESHEQFHARFNIVNYKVVVIEENFGDGTPLENESLKTLQTLPMAQRRHAAILLLGAAFETLNALQAFAQSVHCVVNYSETPLIGQLVQKSVAENDLFLAPFLEIQRSVHLKAK